jgi:hypothetical protein
VVDTLTANWTNARDACSSQGGRLAVFDTHDKMQFIINLFRSGEHNFVKYFFKSGWLLNTAHVAVSHARIFLTCAGQATSSIWAFYVGASRPLGSWGTAWPGGVPDEAWLNGVPVDWSWMKANGFTNNTEPNNPTTESVLVLSKGVDSQVIENTHAIYDRRYICEFR